MPIVTIRIETRAALPFEAFGHSGDHLYLVGVDETGQEFVIRGGPNPETTSNAIFDNILVVAGGLLEDTLDARNLKVSVEQSQIDRGSRILDLGGRNPDDVWNIMVQRANNINSLQIDYDLFNSNSNSTITSVLSAVGINVFDTLPDRPNVAEVWPAIEYILDRNFHDGLGNLLIESFNDFQLMGTSSNDILQGGDGNDFFLGSLGSDLVLGGGFPNIFGNHDTVSYVAFDNNIALRAFINDQSITIQKVNLTLPPTVIVGIDTLVDIDLIIGTSFADVFEVSSLTNGVSISGGSPSGNGNGTASGGRLLSGSAVFSNHNNDTITLSQDLINSGAQVTYLSAQGEGLIWLEVGGVMQRISYTGIFNEASQTQYFAGLTPTPFLKSATVGLSDTGSVMLDFSNSTQAIDSTVLAAIPLFNLVDEFIGSNLGDTIDLALTAANDNREGRVRAACAA